MGLSADCMSDLGEELCYPGGLPAYDNRTNGQGRQGRGNGGAMEGPSIHSFPSTVN